MATATVQDLLNRTQAAADKRAADTQARYGKLVLRAARGEHLEPESVLQSLTSWGIDPADFAEDVEHAATRVELREVADQLPARAAAKAAAWEALGAAEAEYAAEMGRVNEVFGAKIGAARVAFDQAAGMVQQADQAARKLAETCRDADTIAAFDRIQKEQAAAATKLWQAQKDARKWSDELYTAQQTEKHERAAARIMAPGPFGSHNEAELPNTEGRKRRQETIAVAPALIAEAEERAAALTARRAELNAEAAALESRLLDPWPAAGAAGK